MQSSSYRALVGARVQWLCLARNVDVDAPVERARRSTVVCKERESIQHDIGKAEDELKKADKDDVRKALQSQGVDGNAALERVQAMSDAEVAQLAGRIDQAPVGGDILGLIFTVFIVLLVTDILGLTKVFPFTRSVR